MTQRICQIPGCLKKYRCRGFCENHYRAAVRAGTLPPKVKVVKVCTIPDCGKPRKSHGYCSMHAARYERHGDPNFTMCVQDPYEYQTKTRANTQMGEPSDCWEYQGTIAANGYGRISRQWAHRMAYLYWHPNTGAITDGMAVRHSCDNPPCCNPHHLSLGTNADNTQDKVERGRQLRGATVPSSKLTEDDVRAIRSDPRINTEIAADYGISSPTVTEIKRRKTWKHVA